MNKNLKIAIIGSRGYPYVYSGYETLVKELSERLVKKGHKVRVYCHSSLFKKKPRHFLEIGVFHGVTSRNVCDLLQQMHGKDFSFTGIDLFTSDSEVSRDEVIPQTKFSNRG